MDIYTVTLEDNNVLESALEICWQYTYTDLEVAKAAVHADVYGFREPGPFEASDPSSDWCESEDISAIVLEDDGRTWTIFKTELVES